jgi:hypothetical protein
MAMRRHQPRWGDNVVRVLRLLVTLADEIAKVIDAFRHLR